MFIAAFPAGGLAANCYLVAADTGGPCVILDPGEDAMDGVLAAVVEHDLQPVAVVLTHGHLDHAASFGEVSRKFDIPGYLHAADEYMLDDPLAALSPQLRSALADYRLPDMRPVELRELRAAQCLPLAGLELMVQHTPGHTGGSVIVRLAGDGDRPDVLFTGDTLFAGSVGRTDLPGGSSDELNASLRASVLTQPDSAVVLPGHGPQSTIGAERRANPFLQPLQAISPSTRLPPGS